AHWLSVIGLLDAVCVFIELGARVMATKKIPPGPKGLPLIGNLWQVLRDPLNFPTRIARQYGDVARASVGKLVFYMFVHPEHIEYILRGNHKNFSKDKGTRLLSVFLGQGLLTSEGDLWRRQRRLSQPAFQLEQIEKYTEIMVAYTDRMLDGWRVGGVRDIHTDVMKLTLEIVAQALFSASVEGKAEQVGQAMDVVMKYFASFVIYFPWWAKLPTPANRRFRRAVENLNAIIYETIAKRRAGETKGNDLLARLLAARDEDGSQMGDQQIRDELMTLFLAGHETTALALSFTFYLLSLHPDIDTRLANEIDEVLQGRLPTVADLPQLRYTEWVIKESMRLYPPA